MWGSYLDCPSSPGELTRTEVVEQPPAAVDADMPEVKETLAAPVGVPPVESNDGIARGMSTATTVPATEEEVSLLIVI